MTTDVIHVTNKGAGIEEALRQTEAAAAFRGLPEREAIHLRLLAEEMLGMLRALTGERAADFWIESDGGAFRLRLKTTTEMNNDLRRKLLSAASSGENAAAKGVLGRLIDLFERLVEPTDATMPRVYLNGWGWAGAEPLPVDQTAAIVQATAVNTGDVWSLRRCVNNSAPADWDGLERSVIAGIADDVEIGIAFGTVEMTVYKTFPAPGGTAG